MLDKDELGKLEFEAGKKDRELREHWDKVYAESDARTSPEEKAELLDDLKEMFKTGKVVKKP